MNKYIVCLGFIFIAGCAPKTTTAPVVSTPPVITSCPMNGSCPADSFDSAGLAMAASARYVYEKSKDGYYYMTSEETKKKMNEYWDHIKLKADEGSERAKRLWEQHLTESQ